MSQEELPDHAIIVRGGKLDPELLLKVAQRDRRAEDGVYVLSVWCAGQHGGESVEDVLEKLVTEGPIPHSWLNLTTAGALRASGFMLTCAPPPDIHYDVELGSVVDPATVTRFMQVFQETRRNSWFRG